MLRATTVATSFAPLGSHRYDSSWQPATATNIRGWLPAFVGKFMGWKTYGLIVPYWLLVVVIGTLATTLRLGWPPKFTLRGLLLTRTLLAIELAMTVALDHSYATRAPVQSPPIKSTAAIPYQPVDSVRVERQWPDRRSTIQPPRLLLPILTPS